MHDADYKAYYDRKYHEVRKHRHKRAMVLTARKLVRLVVRLLTTNLTGLGGLKGLTRHHLGPCPGHTSAHNLLFDS